MKYSSMEEAEEAEEVTPLAGVWIEMCIVGTVTLLMMSLPLRECGLKSRLVPSSVVPELSLPLRECGLKLCVDQVEAGQAAVTPLAGVWIEIQMSQRMMQPFQPSLPLRECGLKSA